MKIESDRAVLSEPRSRFLATAIAHQEIKLRDSCHAVMRAAVPYRGLWLPTPLFVSAAQRKRWMREQRCYIQDEEKRLREALTEWAIANNLNYPWVLDSVLGMDYIWVNLVVNGPDGSRLPGRSMCYPPLSYRACWKFESEDENQFLKRVASECRDAAREHLQAIKQSRKIATNHGGVEDHYRWAVEYVCLGRSWSDIERKDHLGRSKQAIREAGLKVLRDVGIKIARTSKSRKKHPLLACPSREHFRLTSARGAYSY